MKKLLSVILSIAMIFAASSVALALEYDADFTINHLETISVTASSENQVIIKFVPEVTAKYYVASFAGLDSDGNKIDPVCCIETDVDDYTLIIDDSADGSLNFYEKLEFVAGIVYYFTVNTYSEYDNTFDFALLCAHDYADDTCKVCGDVCDHETEGKMFETCDCGMVSECSEIAFGESTIYTFAGVDTIYLKFTATEDFIGILSSDSVGEVDLDYRASIYDADRDCVASNDDFGGSYEFLIWYEFSAGETYYIAVETYYEDADVLVTFDYAVHTTDDGETHELSYVDREWGNCSEIGHTEGLYCADCDAYILGYEETDYDTCSDDDGDGYCDFCGGNLYADDEDDTDNEEADNSLLEKVYSILQIFINFFESIIALFSNI